MPRFSQPKLPTNSQRIAIIGRTGSGKTVAALWHLSLRNFDSRPWIIVDYKTDEAINSIRRAEHISLGELPKQPGIYIVHPMPHETEAVQAMLWKVWEKENIGVYIDEGYMLGSDPAFEALLTQGRSKHIPMIVLTQRPAWVSRFVFSESDFFQVFHLNDRRDKKTIEAFSPHGISERLPEYHSHYYDVGHNALFRLGPVPKAEQLIEDIDTRLGPRRKVI